MIRIPIHRGFRSRVPILVRGHISSQIDFPHPYESSTYLLNGFIIALDHETTNLMGHLFHDLIFGFPILQPINCPWDCAFIMDDHNWVDHPIKFIHIHLMLRLYVVTWSGLLRKMVTQLLANTP